MADPVLTAAPLAHGGLLHDGLAHWAARMPDKIAMALDDEARATYGELARWSDGVARRLRERGVKAGDIVAIAAANCLEWVAAAIGILKAGGVVAPFNDRLLAEEMMFLATLCEPLLVIADAPRAATLEAAGCIAPLLSIAEIAALREEHCGLFAGVRAPSDALAMILFTSGSTARPKGVMLSHGGLLVKFLELLLLDESLGRDTRSLMPFGLHATPGVVWGILFTTTIGGTFHFTRKYRAERTLETLVREAITYFIGVPMLFDEISRLAGFEQADLSALSFARVGGTSAPPEVFARWLSKGVVIRQLYGMTEVGGTAIVATRDEAASRPEACGRGLAYTTLRITRPDASDCAPDEPGEVLIRGPGLMLGYWRDPQATRAALENGWMRTGDIGVFDSDGYFRFVDRSKEMIKSGGYNVSPAEIEATLMTHDAVAEAVVFAVHDARFAEAPCACVRVSESITPLDLYDHCARTMAAYKLPRYIVVSNDPLPRLANEKFDRRGLKARYRDISLSLDRLGSTGRS